MGCKSPASSVLQEGGGAGMMHLLGLQFTGCNWIASDMCCHVGLLGLSRSHNPGATQPVDGSMIEPMLLNDNHRESAAQHNAACPHIIRPVTGCVCLMAYLQITCGSVGFAAAASTVTGC